MKDWLGEARAALYVSKGKNSEDDNVLWRKTKNKKKSLTLVFTAAVARVARAHKNTKKKTRENLITDLKR